MEWTEKLATGIKTIDSQHRELFKRINNLELAIKEHRCKAEIDATLRFLDEYAQIHFAEEEKHMQETSYSGLQEQREDHKKYLMALAELKEQASQPRIQGSTYDLSATTNQVVVDWIVDHIMKLDMKFGEFLKTQGKEY
ncbi:MAG TPA: bacteriohemerythrin [Nitrospirota bacterium]|nr:bacteriohemerythrin [Nitrospirota bacterium]